MKFSKIIPTLVAVLSLTACAQKTTETPAKTASPQIVESTKSVVYTCQSKKSVTAVYTFANQDPVNAVVKLGRKGKEISLSRDAENKDFVSFVNERYVWNVDTNLTLADFDQAGGAMLTRKGKKSDTILAKLCEVNKNATATLNN